jgi:hypothetical protein
MLDRQTPDVWLRGANIETGGGREGGENVSVMVYYNQMHVKTRLSQPILSKIVAWTILSFTTIVILLSKLCLFGAR